MNMPITTQCGSLSSPGEISVSDSEVEGTDYLLSSTMRLDDAFFQILGKKKFFKNYYITQKKIYYQQNIIVYKPGRHRITAHSY